MRGTIEPVGKRQRQRRRGFDATVAVGSEYGEGERFAEVHRQVAEQMARAAVMMVGILVTTVTARGTGIVAGVARCVRRNAVVPVRGRSGGRLPSEGRGQHRRQQNGNQKASNGSRGTNHAGIVSERASWHMQLDDLPVLP